MSRAWKWLLAVAALATLLGAQGFGDYSIRLPGGYRLTRIYAGALLINHPSRGIAVDANIDGYKVLGQYIVGHTSQADQEPEKGYSKPGYFLVDTKAGSAKQGMIKQAWLDELRKVGITEEPKLEAPSRFDRDY
jgi:hypothetical protein